VLLDLLVVMVLTEMLVVTRHLHMVEHQQDLHQVLALVVVAVLVLVNGSKIQQLVSIVDFMVAVEEDKVLVAALHIMHPTLLMEEVVEVS
jgi:hypothetical protein